MTNIQISTTQTLSFLSQLVSIDSVNPDLVIGGAGESQIAEQLLQICKDDLSLDAVVQEVAPGRPNVIAKWPGNGIGKSILLTGHMDVVGVAEMEIEPFSAEVNTGRLYGRGSYDMKGGIAAILSAISALKTAEFHPRGDIWLGFVCDEEYASIGTEALVKEIKPDAAILTEPTDEIISIAHRGFVWITITTYGKAAHGSDYAKGVDAIQQMAPILQRIKHLEEEIYPKRQHALLGRPSVHASLIHGGLGLSTYPDRCVLQIEHRTLPGEGGDMIFSEWQNFIQMQKRNRIDFDAEVNLDLERSPLEIEPTEPIANTVKSAYNNCFNSCANLGASFGWLDSAIFVEAGIPTVIFGPKGYGAHAEIEWVDLESVDRCAAVIAESCISWCS